MFLDGKFVVVKRRDSMMDGPFEISPVTEYDRVDDCGVANS